MTPDVEMMVKDFDSRVDYWRREGDFTYGEIISALDTVKFGLMMEWYGEEWIVEDEGDGGKPETDTIIE